MKVFKFTVGRSLRAIDADKVYQNISITTVTPMIVFPIQLSRNLHDYEDKLRLAQAELKVEIIRALIDGEWEFEQD